MASLEPLIVEREDPLVIFQFAILFDNAVQGFFTECSGIGSEHEIAEQQAVNEKGHSFVMKVPGIVKYQDITLKRGITSNLDMWEWRAKAEAGNMKEARKNCSIVAYNRQYEIVAQWDLMNAWPSKVSGPDFNSGSSEFGVEELTVVHEGFTRVK